MSNTEDSALISDSSSISEITINSKKFEYCGYEPSIGISDKIEYIKSDIHPELLFNNYIAARKPVVIKNLLSTDEFKTKDWNLSYLKEKAGDTQVLVENRSSNVGTFGISAPKVSMPYFEFLDKLASGCENYYLTTQELTIDKLDKFGMCTEIMGNPLVHLKEDFPQAPKLFSSLVPHLISVWQGYSKDGVSSGLHHDFHDNLYLVVRGSKKLRILPPSSHQYLKMPYKPVRIYPNGLIVYSRNRCYPDLIPVRSDGVPYEFLAQTIRDKARAELARCRAELKRLKKEKGSAELIKLANNEKLEFELQIDAAEDEIVQYNGDDDRGSNHISIEDSDEEPSEKIPKMEAKPLEHFSAGSLKHSASEFDEIFSDFELRKDLRCLEVDLNAGDALYLPASWFHDVTSYSCASETTGAVEDHLALSYWFYPPDGETVDKPYINNFWQDRLMKIASGSPDIMPADPDENLSDDREEVSEYDVIVLGSDDDDDDDNIDNDSYSDEESTGSWRPRSVEIDHFSEHSVDLSSSPPDTTAPAEPGQKEENNSVLSSNSVDDVSNHNHIGAQQPHSESVSGDNVISKITMDGIVTKNNGNNESVCIEEDSLKTEEGSKLHNSNIMENSKTDLTNGGGDNINLVAVKNMAQLEVREEGSVKESNGKISNALIDELEDNI